MSIISALQNPLVIKVSLFLISHELATLWMEFERLVPDHLLQDLFGGLEVIPAPIERLFAFWLNLLVVQAFEVGVL